MVGAWTADEILVLHRAVDALVGQHFNPQQQLLRRPSASPDIDSRSARHGCFRPRCPCRQPAMGVRSR